MQVEFYLAGEITQVIDSIPWVRCASSNVCSEDHSMRTGEKLYDYEEAFKPDIFLVFIAVLTLHQAWGTLLMRHAI